MGASEFIKQVVCIGAGYVGGPTMAMIAAKCPRYRVTIVDINAEKIAAWQTDQLPVYEPGLLAVVRQALGRNLFFSTDIPAAIKAADIIFVSINTPTKQYGQGAGKTADLQYWEKTARDILEAAHSDKIIVEKSTLPLRTAEAMERILSTNGKGLHFDVLSNPEFLAEGTAIQDLECPDRVLIGGRQTEPGRRAVQELVDLYAHWVPRERILTCDVWSAELSKLVANAFLAQRISSINSISALCERSEADVQQVAQAIGMDTRIGARFLNASVGFGGSCFKKDILNLVYICEYHGLIETARYWEAVVQMNDYQQQRFVRRMIHAMFNTLATKRIVLLGFAFKADTGDTRESPAYYVCRQLLEERADVCITDPQALNNARLDLADVGERVRFIVDPYTAVQGAHALAVMTEWRQYRELDYERIYSLMQKPAFIFDGRNLLDHQRLFALGFNVYPLGKKPLTHFSDSGQ